MILPDVKIEKRLIENGFLTAIGIDEAGRGPLAGPVIAAAVLVLPEMLDADFENRNLIRDSKTLSEAQREKIFTQVQGSEKIFMGIGEISHTVIDKVNILNATFYAMRLALDDLISKLSGDILQEKICVLVDGNKKIPHVNYRQHTFPGGDQNIFSISLASICAKVHRDRLMDRYHEKYPLYGFDRHRGYGTQLHMDRIKEHGPCEIHRLSFAPLKGT